MTQAWVPPYRLLQDVVLRGPSRPAVRHGHLAITYEDLWRRACQIAWALSEAGVELGQPVGVFAPRSPAWIESFWGVMAAGAAYVPLDPTDPPARWATLVADAGVGVVLASRELAAAIRAADLATTVLLLDSIGHAAPELEPRAVDEESLAYVLFTSGSTGRPKGVQVEARSLSHLARSQARYFGIQGDEQILQLASPGFDVSISEIVMAHATGACLHLIESPDERFGEALVSRLARSEISVVSLTPSVLATLGSAALPTLTTLIVGGEPCPPALIAQWREGRRMFLVYGPTEATVCCAVHECDERSAPLLGAAVPDTELTLVDRALEPVPEGEIGEILVVGPGVARGYLTGADARFVALSGGRRGYRTGDLARRAAGGELEFVGRVDDQIKVRGVRVEPGEIESVLSSVAGVRACAVVASPDNAGRSRLVAWVVLEGDESSLVDAMRSTCRRLLPERLQPRIEAVPSLPLLASGKIDRRALSARPLSRRREQPLVSGDPAIARVVSVVCDVLELDTARAEDDFFDLGGDSLSATRLATRLRGEFGVELSTAMVFRTRKIERIAEAVRAAPRAVRGPTRTRDRRLVPPSFGQERICFAEAVATGDQAYVAQSIVRFRGPIAVDALEHALSTIVERHEILRTHYPLVDGARVQVVEAPRPVVLAEIDLRGERGRSANELLAEKVAEEVRVPFDVGRPPLIRWKLFRLTDEELVLFQHEHHMLHDGWSSNVLLAELTELCSARVEGRPPTLAALPIQWVDFVRWQREWITGPEAKAQMAYWVTRLADGPRLLALPTDRPRPSVARFRGRKLRVEVSSALNELLLEGAKSLGATPFVLTCSAFAILLAMYSGDTDINVGTTVANRRWQETEIMIGMFVNTVVLRADMSGDPTFAEVVARLQDVSAGAQENQDVPFEHVVRELRVPRTLSHNPLFQVAWNYHDAPRAERPIRGVEVELEEALDNGSAKFDIAVVAIPRPGDRGLTVIWEYDVDLFDEVNIARIAALWGRLLEAGLRDPATRMSNMLEQAEPGAAVRPELLSRALLDERPVPAQVLTQARRCPSALAAVGAGELLSYGALDELSASLATRLRGAGVRRGDVVALLVPRAPIWVAAAMGVFRAGAAYMALDLEEPLHRMSTMLTDAAPRAIVTTPEFEAIARQHHVPVVLARGEAIPVGSIDETLGADDLAYITFTSGSTGRPKGVEILHRGLTNLIDWQRRELAIGPGTRMASAASLRFDASAFEAWATLAAGGTLHFAPDGARLDPSALAAWIVESGVEVAFVTTALATVMLDLPWTVPCRLRLLLTGGEALLARPRPGLPFTLMNVYGPSEGSAISTGTVVAPGAGTPNIGRALPNTWAIPLDASGRPVPRGVPAEICIGGANVGRGYIGSPDETAQRFVVDPFGPPGARMYRTGDYGRIGSDGELQFLGRRDRQIKSRGFRIEPEEIEVTLAKARFVRNAAVLVSGSGESVRLVACCEVEPGTNEDEVRRHLAARLPVFLMPSAYVLLDRFPTTLTGKIDRDALLAMTPALRSGGRAPEGPIEQEIAGAFCEVLAVPSVPADADFFEMGGHSMLALRLVTRLQARSGITLGVKEFYAEPTVAGVARRSSARAVVSAVDPPGANTLALTLSQRRWWDLHWASPGRAACNISIAHTITGDLDIDALERSIRHVLGRHGSLRTRWENVLSDAPIQRVLVEGGGALERLCRSGADSVECLTAFAAKPFDLEREAPVRAGILPLDDRTHALVIVAHHLAVDGWSLGLILDELAAAYLRLTSGMPLVDEPAPCFIDVASRESPASELCANELSDEHVIPLGLSRGGRSSPAGSRFRELPADATGPLLAWAQPRGATPFMVFLTVFCRVIARWRNRRRFLVASPIAARRDALAASTVGCFTQALVMAADVVEGQSFEVHLATVQAWCLRAYSDEGPCWESMLESARSRGETPPDIELLFTLPPALPPLRLAGTECEEIELPPAFVDVPLRWEIVERGGTFSHRVSFARGHIGQGEIDALLDRFDEEVRAAAAVPEARSEPERRTPSTPNPTLVQELRAALGDPAVVDDPGELARLSANVSSFRARRVPLVVRPGSPEDVLRLVEIANRRGTPLYPFSTGLSWGLGSKLPVVDGCALVDLRGLTRIREVSERGRFAVIEPGVTQRALHEHITKLGLRVRVNATGSSPDSSIVGNILDRGTGFHRARADDLRGVEVVLGRGELVRTGYWGLAPSRLPIHHNRHGIGPRLDPLFQQSNFGIVTAAVIDLRPVTEQTTTFSWRFDASELERAFDSIADLYREGVIRSVVHIYDDHRIAGSKTSGQSWFCVGSLSGATEVVAGSRAALLRRLEGIGTPPRFFERGESEDPRTEALIALVEGTPTDGFFAAMRNFDADRGPDLDTWRTGMTCCLPAVPLEGSIVRDVVDTARDVAKSHGVRCEMSLNPLDGDLVEAVLNLYFDREDASAVQRAHRCNDVLHSRLADLGLRFLRLDVERMSWVVDEAQPHWRLASMIKHALDPRGVISPGRYGG